MDDVPRMIGIKRASEKTGLSYKFLNRLCRTGEIISIKSGNKYLINEQKLKEYLNNPDKKKPIDIQRMGIRKIDL